jgi:hypothetical protein
MANATSNATSNATAPAAGNRTAQLAAPAPQQRRC